jgi:hypothetical protein
MLEMVTQAPDFVASTSALALDALHPSRVTRPLRSLADHGFRGVKLG